MPQKNHEQAASHHVETTKNHRAAAKHASEGNHEKAAQHTQAAHGNSQNAKKLSKKVSEKYIERVNRMEDDGNQIMTENTDSRSK